MGRAEGASVRTGHCVTDSETGKWALFGIAWSLSPACTV
ncbi:hypothetical protein PAMC26577_25570 [Caballeronia sordidicola]|uniref:Uncharacterized protein n=1 Tax=Caballeronia sordidicola TaxID=196367 RepID=A0A242MJJ2_CABSO|nr:hypothetical protein PAMC26577_25570 [Caballeronia sordidicola]